MVREVVVWGERRVLMADQYSAVLHLPATAPSQGLCGDEASESDRLSPDRVWDDRVGIFDGADGEESGGWCGRVAEVGEMRGAQGAVMRVAADRTGAGRVASQIGGIM